MNDYIFNSNDKARQYVICFATILILSGICFLVSDIIGYRVVAFLLLLAVSILATIFDILPVLLSATLSAFIWNYFFIPPKFTIQVHTAEDTFLLVMYFVIALINGVLTYRIRKVEKAYRLKEERANSIQLYNTILNSLSHELRTPIAAIICAADNLQLNEHLSKTESNQLISEISKASVRLNQQVENLLNISRLESGHIKPKNDWCDIVELVYTVVKRVEENSPERKIGININQNMPICKLDKGMLDQVLYNLINNAAIHTPVDAAINVSASCHGNLLEVLIEDSGKGFPEKKFNDIFSKFSRDKHAETAGSGLGLSIVKGFTEALGGSVIYDKGPSQGARFLVTIPVKVKSISEINE